MGVASTVVGFLLVLLINRLACYILKKWNKNEHSEETDFDAELICLRCERRFPFSKARIENGFVVCPFCGELKDVVFAERLKGKD